MESIAGQTLHGKYRIDELIGRGGMGSVYKGEHVGTGRPVAVKTILPRLVTDPSSIERFRREARAAGSLRHPNIVDVTDFGVARVGDDEVAYLVMEYLQGSTLRALLEQEGALRTEVVIDLVEQIALALDAAHGLGIVHRDLKPENIWLIPDPRGGYVVRILDFGIAKLRENVPAAPPRPASGPVSPDPERRAVGEASAGPADRESPLPPSREDEETLDQRPTSSAESKRSNDSELPTVHRSATSASSGEALTELGSTLGTPAYMSPEQCVGGPVDARSDIYSLGILAWQALAGRRPFEGNHLELIRQHLEVNPRRVDEVNAAVPRRVGEAIAVATAKRPEERYPTAGAMAGSIRVASEGPTVILRRSMALYLEQFGPFLRASVRSTTPALALVGLEVVAFLALWLLFLRPAGHELTPGSRIALAVVAQTVGILSGVLWMLVTAMHHAVFSAVVGDLRSRPFARIDVEAILADLRRRIGLHPSAGLTRTLVSLAIWYARSDVKGPAGQGDLAFQIAFHEGGAGAGLKDRCRVLSHATKKSYDWIRVFIVASILLPPAFEASLAFAAGSLLGLTAPRAAGLAVLGALVLVPVNAIVLNPGISPALAVLYFRARQALGENVGLSAVMPSRL